MRAADVVLTTFRLTGAGGADELAQAWSTLSPNGLDRLVHYEGGALWLERRLPEVGARPAPDFMAWLTRATRATTARTMIVEAAAADALSKLAVLGVPVILLKGVARRAAAAAGLHPWADARPTHDVDLLVPESAAQEAWERLQTLGYMEAPPPPGGPFRTVHLRPLWNQHRVAVEIHTSTALAVPPSEAWRRQSQGARTVGWMGLPCLIPSSTELVWHAITHGLQHGPDAYRLRHFLDAAAILEPGAAAVDWSVIRDRLKAGEDAPAEVAWAWLAAAAWLGGLSTPPLPELRDGAAELPLDRLLRWRLAVLRYLPFTNRMGERLIHEGTRAEVSMPLTPTVPGTPLWKRARRRSAAAAARIAFLLWRGVQAHNR